MTTFNLVTSTNRGTDRDLLPTAGFAATCLRLTLAVWWIVHWWYKVGTAGMPATEAFFLHNGLPAWLASFDISLEVVVALCLIFGLYVSLVCIMSLPIFFAAMIIYRTNGFYFLDGRIELPILGNCSDNPRANGSRAILHNASCMVTETLAKCAASSALHVRVTVKDDQGSSAQREIERQWDLPPGRHHCCLLKVTEHANYFAYTGCAQTWMGYALG